MNENFHHKMKCNEKYLTLFKVRGRPLNGIHLPPAMDTFSALPYPRSDKFTYLHIHSTNGNDHKNHETPMKYFFMII